jgi:hypothetical protein
MRNRALPADTTLEAMRAQIKVHDRLGFDGRLRMVVELSENVRRIAAAEIRRRHPEYTDDEVRLAEIRLRLGEKLFREAYPGVDVQP